MHRPGLMPPQAASGQGEKESFGRVCVARHLLHPPGKLARVGAERRSATSHHFFLVAKRLIRGRVQYITFPLFGHPGSQHTVSSPHVETSPTRPQPRQRARGTPQRARTGTRETEASARQPSPQTPRVSRGDVDCLGPLADLSGSDGDLVLSLNAALFLAGDPAVRLGKANLLAVVDPLSENGGGWSHAD